MVLKRLANLFSSDSNEKVIRQLQPLVDRINALEPEFAAMSDAGLRAKTAEFRQRVKDGAKLDDLIPEAFAAVREASKRSIGLRHFDVQLVGGMVLHQGRIAEMKTGEGKTLVATLPAYLNSLSGEGCHLVTVNDYLARRDAHWMGAVYDRLGVSVASIYGPEKPGDQQPSSMYDAAFDSGVPARPHLKPCTRREAYAADITYGTNNEFGFDYLRDNMVVDLAQCVQRPLNYAIVDEVDNILIDEARTPLIISGGAEETNQKRKQQMELYAPYAQIARGLKPGEEADFVIEAKTRTVKYTESGDEKVDRLLKQRGLLKAPSRYDLEGHSENQDICHRMDNALRAETLYKLDRDYIVDAQKGLVIIVDEFTGRLMFGRRYADGLHEAIEAKEGVFPRLEMVTLATVTFQNYFRMYRKLAGMTGTAATEAEEFFKIYKLEVVIVPTNKPMVRDDFDDLIYKNEEGKFKAAAEEIKVLHQQGRPVLVGTVSIEKSEHLTDLLKRIGVTAQVLNAKHHEKEAGIISQAGRLGAVTVATSMAGRGVDIILGGTHDGRDPKEWQAEHDKVVSLGGLHVLGTERYEARRIDNQLRGRSGRQGDPGSSRFYVSLDDDVIKRFGGERIQGFMNWAGLDETTPIEHQMVSRAIENSQKRVEGYNFDIRKHLVEYDDVVNKQREIIYGERRKLLGGADLKSNVLDMVAKEIDKIAATHYRDPYNPDVAALLADVSGILPPPPDMTPESAAQKGRKELTEELVEYARVQYEAREKQFGAADARLLERLVMLRVIDGLWKEHLTSMEEMRQGIGLHSVGQSDPLIAYKQQGFKMFDELTADIRRDVVRLIFRVNIERKPAAGTPVRPSSTGAGPVTPFAPVRPQKAPIVAQGGKTPGRNDPCPCGSGKKYKKCCGA